MGGARLGLVGLGVAVALAAMSQPSAAQDGAKPHESEPRATHQIPY